MSRNPGTGMGTNRSSWLDQTKTPGLGREFCVQTGTFTNFKPLLERHR